MIQHAQALGADVDCIAKKSQHFSIQFVCTYNVVQDADLKLIPRIGMQPALLNTIKH